MQAAGLALVSGLLLGLFLVVALRLHAAQAQVVQRAAGPADDLRGAVGLRLNENGLAGAVTVRMYGDPVGSGRDRAGLHEQGELGHSPILESRRWPAGRQNL